jgi:Ca2+-binding EF-hand superfamily protein
MTNRVAAGSSKESVRKVFPLYDDEKTEHISVKNLRRVAMDLGEQIE